jgi:polyhydroxybutyrate depolymerase
MADEQGDVSVVACKPDRPVSVLAIHGSADSEVPTRGGGRFAAQDDVIRRWREMNGCNPSGSVIGNGPATTTAWRCQAGSEVRSILVQGAGITALALGALGLGALALVQ